jgi:hypothetical protein
MAETIGDTDDKTVKLIMALFEGYTEAYGTYDAGKTGELKRGKVEIKSTARTVRAHITEELWRKHLSGEASLGVIPIRANNTCYWGCIDIDQYGISHVDLVRMLSRHKLPLIVCRSKSGGAHMFLFMAEPVPAEEIQAYLRNVAVLLGYGNTEVFPKQKQVAIERGDLGSWLNMPYFGGDESDRYCIDDQGRGMTTDDFAVYADSLRQPAVFLQQQPTERSPEVQETGKKSSPDFGDGPPCMQHLSAVGYPEGSRNKGLFALAVFAKKKFGGKWQEMVEKWNRDFFDPPLPSSEVSEILRGHEKKDYYYTCKEQPIASHCNSQVCRTRKYGVGGDDDFPVISGLSVLDTDPPLWFMDVEDARVELTTEELQQYRSFHRICMEKLFKCFRMMKQDAWLQVVSEAMRSATRIDAPSEVGRAGHFYELLTEFLTNRHRGTQREDLLVGRPIIEDERYYFRLQDLMRFLENSNFHVYSRAQIVTRIKRLGGDQHFFNIKGKGTNTFYIPATMEQMPEIDTPEIAEDPL